MSADAVLSGPIIFHQPSRLATINGCFVLLSPHEFALLQALCSQPNETISQRASLLALLYPSGDHSTKLLDVAIYRLRRKLAECGFPDLIRTVRLQGYAMVQQCGDVLAASAVTASAIALAA